MESKNNRKIKLINRAFQSRLIFQFAIINGLILLLFASMFFLFIDSEVNTSLARAQAPLSSLSDLLFPIVFTLTLLHIVLSSVLIAVVVLYASHRIAGPMYRFQQAIMEISQRNLNPMTRIRDNDQAQELSTALSTMTQQLCSDMTSAKDQLEKALNLPDGPDKQDQLLKLKKLLDLYQT